MSTRRRRSGRADAEGRNRPRCAPIALCRTSGSDDNTSDTVTIVERYRLQEYSHRLLAQAFRLRFLYSGRAPEYDVTHTPD